MLRKRCHSNNQTRTPAILRQRLCVSMACVQMYWFDPNLSGWSELCCFLSGPKNCGQQACSGLGSFTSAFACQPSNLHPVLKRIDSAMPSFPARTRGLSSGPARFPATSRNSGPRCPTNRVSDRCCKGIASHCHLSQGATIGCSIRCCARGSHSVWVGGRGVGSLTV